MQICSKCGCEKPADQFKATTGQQCRTCRNAYAAAWKLANPEKVRRYAAKNPERRSAKDKASRERRAGIITRFPTAKVCTGCGQEKEIGEFSRQPYTRDGKQARCRRCQSQTAMAWNRANPERFRANQRRSVLKLQYGITPERYDEMLTEQGGGCAICGAEPQGRNRLAVDHCHRTGAVRGLLCFGCNTLLGKLADDPVILHRAIGYLGRAEADEQASTAY